MSARTTNWLVAAAVAALILGAILSRVIEPGVRVERIMLTTNTPALRIFPLAPGPHPIALLAHGSGASKEMLFRLGEALAAAGFDCYCVDLAGHGESPHSYSPTNCRLNFLETARALGEVDVFIGQSMGSGAGSWSVREAGFRPKLFVAVGNTATLGEHGPAALLLFGRFEEFGIPAQTSAQVVISPWSDHALEAFDPVLVNAAVKAACATVGKPVPAAPTAWRWRLAGLVLGMAGGLILMFRLPGLHPRLLRARRVIVPAILLIAMILTMGTWIGMTPQWRRIPQQLVLLVFIWLALAGLGRLGLPRWSLPVVTGILTIVLGLVHFSIPLAYVTGIFLSGVLMTILVMITVSFLPSLLVGRIAARGGSRRDGDIAIAIFASYGIGQFMPLFYSRPNTEVVFKAAFWTLLVSMFLMRFWFGIRVWRSGERILADRAAHQREGLWAHVVGYVFYLLLAAVVLDFWFQGGNLQRFAFPAPSWLRWAGLGLGIISVGLFAWTHAVLGRFWSPYLQLRPGHRLIAEGPYARIRHPMYAAILGWMISLGLVTGNWIPFVFAALSALNFLLRIQGEEIMMLQQFGDEYREYMRRTGRFLPALPEV